jgi:integrase
MRKRAWVHQRESQIKKHGAKAAWLVDWIDPQGRRRRQSCGPGAQGKRDAQKLADRIHSELVTGAYEDRSRTTWDEAVTLYQERVLATKDPTSAETARISLATFAEVMKPGKMRTVDAGALEQFVAKRLAPPKDPEADLVSPATVNRELRYVRHLLKKAKRWKIINDVPEIPFVRVPEKLPTFVPPEHFAAIYQACGLAKRPKRVPNVSAADWWRAIIVFAYMTGWRIGSILKLEWENVDLVNGTAFSPAKANKGRRDVLVTLHPLVVEHLAAIKGNFSTRVFPWPHTRRALWTVFGEIQESTKLPDGSALPRGGKDGRRYGFHDLRRGFATMNAGQMDLFELQRLMQHKSLETTRIYVAMAHRLKNVTDRLFVPQLKRSAAN